ncbi:MAG TPA: MarR family winged helix-turn-helix transcriptional regulator [Alphaproteobacteria bacterium]
MNQPSKADVIQLAKVVDHLVDAVGDPSATLRRAMILLDIDLNPGTTLNAVGERLQLEKSVSSRNVDWLWNQGCVLRKAGREDARELELETSPYAHKHLQLALRPFGNHHEVLIKNLNTFIDLFQKHMPTLRELKALLTVGVLGQASRTQVINNLYDGPPTTDQRAVRHLIEEGVFKTIEK